MAHYGKPRTEWFEDARCGLFIHFGLYSIPAGVWNGQRMGRNDYAEWIRMQHNWPTPGGIPRAEDHTLMARFNPTRFDAGAWMEANGEAIHGARPARYPEPAWGRLTRKRTADGTSRLYAFVYDPRPGAVISIIGPSTPPARARVLETDESLSVKSVQGAGFDVTLPGSLPDDNILVIGME